MLTSRSVGPAREERAGTGLVSIVIRLRPWARPTLEVVAWLALAVTSALVGAFGYAETRVPGGANLAGAILWLVALDVLLAVAIRAIRKPDVRAAFRAEISSAP